MYTVAILPWLELEQPLIVDEFELVPVNKLVLPDANTQAIVSRVIGMHRVAEKASAERATILRYVDRPPTVELTQHEKDHLFDFVELLAFSGMSAREFFGLGNTYCARDNFRLSIIALPTVDSGLNFHTRRRDGHTKKLSNTPKYHIPDHVLLNRINVDIPLFTSLVSSWNSSEYQWWPRVFESILGFNAANTDSSSVPEHFELISLVGSFQRLMDTSSDERKLRRTFHQLLATKIDQAGIETTQPNLVNSCTICLTLRCSLAALRS